MPNWVENSLTITGDIEQLNKLAEQVSQPYTQEVEDWQTHEISEETVKGNFLLWNIVKPTDLDAYYERSERLVREAERIMLESHPNPPKPPTPEEMRDSLVEAFSKPIEVDFASVAQEFESKLAVENGWYYWNIRNWGTKWELTEAWKEQFADILQYSFQSAWSPPAEAISLLAKQYPMLSFSMSGLDEGDNFAYAIEWENGEMVSEEDLQPSHELSIQFRGECWNCSTDTWEEYLENAEYREAYGCPERTEEDF